MKVAVVGAGISGLVAAYELAISGVKVVVYEKEHYLGSHAKTVTVNDIDLDLGFMVFNGKMAGPAHKYAGYGLCRASPLFLNETYSNLIEFFELVGVDMNISDMSFSVSLDQGRGCEWGTRNGFSSLFAQKMNVLNPYFWQMIREIIRFKQDVISYLEELDNNPDIDCNETLGQFIKSHGYSELFQKAYLAPICASIWSCSSERVMGFSAYYILSFFHDQHLLQLFGLPQLLTVKWQSHIDKVKEELEKRGCQIRTNCEVNSVTTNEEDERYDSHRQSTDFMREYIFPGGCLPALSRIISGMAAASRLCVVHVEEIGIHYYQTLRCWRNNFLKNKRQIRALGFDDKFIRTWEYYFDYCAAGFKTRTFGDYQIVFSRPGNVATFGDPYNVTVSTVY
ncbi:hypothetical protein KY284_037075 [Solanum tuberosum]|nr:hypothetical protein KY284_037075 [Solanum tuberosum]